MQQAADSKNATKTAKTSAEYDIGVLKARDSHKNEACHWFELASNQSAEALGRYCECLPQPSARDECIRRAAEWGNNIARNNLGVTLANQRNYTGAAAWWKLAAQDGLHDAQFNLALALEHGMGVDEDQVEARFWYQQAVDQGDPPAMYNLGSMLEAGRGGKVDPTTAAELFDKARRHHVTQRVEVPSSRQVREIRKFEIARETDEDLS